MDNAHYGMKKYAGSAMAAMLIFGAVAAAFVGLFAQPAYAAVSMSPSATTFFGPGFVRVLINDDSKDSAGDTIVPTIEAREGSTSLGSVSPTIYAIGTSGTFELFITTSNSPLVPAAPTHTADPDGGGALVAGPFIVRVNTAPSTGATALGAGVNANGATVATIGANNLALTTSSALEAGNTIRVNYGGQTLDINFDDQTASLASDRTSAGEDNEIVLALTDRDANLDSTLVDTFTFATPTNFLTSTNAITYNSALWQETGQNTGIFEQTIVVNGPAGTNQLVATLPTGNTFTAIDHEVYEALGAATAPFNAIDSTSSTTSASVTLQNFDAVVTLMNSTSFANGLKVQITDPDRNISTQEEDDLVAGSFALGGTAAATITDNGAGDTSEVFTNNGITVTTTTATSGTITIVNTLDFSANPGATTATVGVAGTGAGLTLGTATVAIGTPAGADPNTATVTIPFSTTGAISAISVGTITVTLTTTTAAETLNGVTPVASATSNPISVIVQGQAGVVSGVTFTETGDNTGIFVADLTRDSIQILTGGAVAVGPTSITLTNAVVETEPDIEFNYNDSAPQTGTSKIFKVVTSLETTAGTLTSPIATVGVTDKFTLELTDADLNTNPETIETYTVSSGTFPNGIGTLALEAANAAVALPVTGLTISFIETGPNTGIFRASNLEMGAINTAVAGGLEDGERVEFTYNDLMESPDEDSDTTISIGIPNEDIVVDRTTVPIPVTTAVKINLTVTDPNANTNSGSTETVTIPVVDQIVQPASGRTLVIGDFTSGINSVITLTETGPSTGIFTEEIDLLSTATVANLRDAKITFEYGDESVTVTLRAFDGSISSDKAAVRSGDKFNITVADQDRNRDPTVAEKTVQVLVESVDDDIDSQTFTLTETGANTGIFREEVEVGTDIEVADPANEDFSTALELTYVDAIASDGGSDDREATVRIATSSGAVILEPEAVGPGTEVIVTITDTDLNENPAGVDTIEVADNLVEITSDEDNEEESLGFEETGPNTGVFEATIQMSPRAANADADLTGAGNDFEYTVLPGDTVSIRYTDNANQGASETVVSRTFVIVSEDPEMEVESQTVAVGGVINLTINDADANEDGDALDSVQVKITSTSDAVGFNLSAQETGANSGNFTLQIPTSVNLSSGSIAVKNGDTVTIEYEDEFPADYADRVETVLDPSKDFTITVRVGAQAGDLTATTPSAPVLKDISGAEVDEVAPGEQVVISVDVNNNNNFAQDFTAIVEVRTADDITEYLQWQTGTLNPDGSVNVGLSWIPADSGEYTIRTFVVSNLQNPAVLSSVEESTVTVS
jgi:hypothetical protein